MVGAAPAGAPGLRCGEAEEGAGGAASGKGCALDRSGGSANGEGGGLTTVEGSNGNQAVRRRLAPRHRRAVGTFFGGER